MLQEMHATARRQEMHANADQARLVAQLGAPGDGRPSIRRQPRPVTLAAMARTLLNGGVVLTWSFPPKGARFGR